MTRWVQWPVALNSLRPWRTVPSKAHVREGGHTACGIPLNDKAVGTAYLSEDRCKRCLLRLAATTRKESC